MKKSLAAGLAMMVCSSMAIAQPATTAPAENAATTASQRANPAARQFTQEQFNRRWAVEEKMYKDAGISEEKIQKLRDLNQEIWKARSEGNKANFQNIMKQRQQILTPDEVQKLRDLRREEMDRQLGERATTATRAAQDATTVSVDAVPGE